MAEQRHVLVAGASGLVGYAAMKHFAGLADCKVTAVSRRRPAETFGARFISVDLTDAQHCAEIFGAMGDVTHLVYAALFEKPGLVKGWVEDDQIATNGQMLRNLFEPLEKAASGLQHVTFLQGTKAYGVHVRALAVPAREDRSEMREQKNFYWEQEDYIRAKQAGREWAWTILRPQIICGLAIGAPLNAIAALGVYGALLKEEGKPLYYPGGASGVVEAVDTGLLARAIGWAGETQAARNGAFNVTNGDVFTWNTVWPAIADAMGMQAGPPMPQSLELTMPARAGDWDRVRAKYGLVSPGLIEFVGSSFQFADMLLGYDVERGAPRAHTPPFLVSTVKIRRAGFQDVMDTEEMFRHNFREFQEKLLLPPR